MENPKFWLFPRSFLALHKLMAKPPIVRYNMYIILNSQWRWVMVVEYTSWSSPCSLKQFSNIWFSPKPLSFLVSETWAPQLGQKQIPSCGLGFKSNHILVCDSDIITFHYCNNISCRPTLLLQKGFVGGCYLHFSLVPWSISSSIMKTNPPAKETE